MSKKIAIMQPYIFPYLGYFQLVSLVDEFIFYDDVNFIKKGWIHRNYIHVNGKKYLFSIPLEKKSQNKAINETNIKRNMFKEWKEKFLTSLKQNYATAPNFKPVEKLVHSILNSDCETIAGLSSKSIIAVANYLEFNTTFKFSSHLDSSTTALKAEDRILSICNVQAAKSYYNLKGGKDLYEDYNFKEKNIDLKFIQLEELGIKELYPQLDPYISIIDLLMFLDKKEMQELLKLYKLD